MKFNKLKVIPKNLYELKKVFEYEDLLEQFELYQLILKNQYDKLKRINEMYSNEMMKPILYYIGTIRINNIEGLKRLIYDMINNQGESKDQLEMFQKCKFITCAVKIFKSYTKLRRIILKLRNRKLILIK